MRLEVREHVSHTYWFLVMEMLKPSTECLLGFLSGTEYTVHYIPHNYNNAPPTRYVQMACSSVRSEAMCGGRGDTPACKIIIQNSSFRQSKLTLCCQSLVISCAESAGIFSNTALAAENLRAAT